MSSSSSSSSHKAFAIIALVFLLLSSGFSRNLIQSAKTGDTFASSSPPAPTLFEEGKAREMVEDYEDAGPNTNKRSGLTLPSPTPYPEAPAPQP